jgi:hypothetical protein
MGNPVDETRDSDAQPIGDEAAALEADDDEYEMVDPSELVDVLKEEVLEAASPPSPPSPPRATISSASFLTMSETVPPIPRPSKDRSGGRDGAWSTKRAAAAAAITVALTAAFFRAKRGDAPTSAPSSEVAAAIPAQVQPEAVATDPIATAAAVPTPETPEPTPSPSPAATVHPSKVAKESPPAQDHNSAPPSSSERAELAAIALKVGAPKAAACTMNFNTIPPSRVALDGRDLGMTPKLGVSVPPGTHVVTFANAGGKKVTSAPCKPGEQKTVSMRLPI